MGRTGRGAGRHQPSLFLLADVEVHGDQQDEGLDHELVVDLDRQAPMPMFSRPKNRAPMTVPATVPTPP